MLRTAMISAAMLALLGSSSALAAAPTTSSNPNCASITNPVLKKACEQKPPGSCNDPSKPGNGNNGGGGNGGNGNNGNNNGNNNQCPVSK